jgi:hypothetical protein
MFQHNLIAGILPKKKGNCGLAYDSKKGGDDDDDEDRIIGGEQVTPNRYPWITELVLYLKKKNKNCCAPLTVLLDLQ